MAQRRLAQRPDLAAVTELVRELDDVGHAAEVLEQPNGSAEGLARQVVDRGLAVIEPPVGDVGEDLRIGITNRLFGAVGM